MAGCWRGAAAATTGTVLLLLSLLVCVSPAHPHPTLNPPPTGQSALITTSSSQAGGGWSLKDTVLRLDELLQRHNDYNDVMLESGEEDDQLSRLLYRLQHGDRVREGWYDEEPLTQPLPPIPRPDATTRTHRRRREHRPESTGLTRPADKAHTHKEKKTKKSKGKRAAGKRSR